MKHFRRWGAVYILVVLFAGSWFAQAVTMMDEVRAQGWHVFWNATLENWQSEWLQLVFQSVLLLGAKHWLFQVDAKDVEIMQQRIKDVNAKLDRLVADRERSIPPPPEEAAGGAREA